MSAARPISPISEGAPARSDNDAGSAERSLSQGNSAEQGSSPAIRRRLPDERRALTHHFSIGGQEGYLTVGVYYDGLPGEIFITMAKQGSTISGLMDAFATVVSLALQHGVPLSVICQKLSHMLGRGILNAAIGAVTLSCAKRQTAIAGRGRQLQDGWIMSVV